MSQLNAIAATQSVKDRLLDFCRSDHYVTDPQVDQICQSIWGGSPRNGGLSGDLWVEAAFPPRGCGQTMKDHVQDRLITEKLAGLLDRNGAFRMDWELREIQSKSMRTARTSDGSADKPAIVVSAGTGAGKTESFLFPMLDELMRNGRTPHAGVSAIILYPMNALVTDQVDRLTNWLQGQTGLKIFHFTGETPEDHRAAQNKGYPQVADCCFRTRQEARGLETAKGKAISAESRGDQPDVIVTNYSMLEYMLCRPQDAVFFGKNLRHIVLDEAHLYTGNLAAEITLLLRRLANKCGVEASAITHYATSATLVEGEVAEQEAALRRFGSSVFSKPENMVTVILGNKAEPQVETPKSREPAECPESNLAWPAHAGIEEIGNCDQLVVSDKTAWKVWMQSLAELLPDLDTEWSEIEPKAICRFLQQKLPKLRVFQHLYHLLYENRIQPLETLASNLWGESGESACEATRRLLQAGAIARPEPALSPLLPNRIHWSIRAPSGLFFSFAHEFAPHESQVYKVNRNPVGYFYSPGYFSRPEEDKTHPLLVMRDADSGGWLLAGVENGSRLVTGEEALPKTKESLEALLERLSFFQLDDGTPRQGGVVLEFDHHTGKVGSGIPLRKIEYDESGRKTIRPMGSDSRLQLSVIAESVLMEMPPYPGDSKCWKPAGGRRLLVFSDSRREAATLGPSLTGNHERQLFRALVVEGLQGLGANNSGDLDTKITELQQILVSVPVVARGAIQKEIEALKAQRTAAADGLSPEQFVEMLKSSIRVKEFFDRKKGERHVSTAWRQAIFERNGKEIQSGLSHRLSQELARKTLWPDLNLESAGFLELAYPGIEGMKLADDYLGELPRADLREKLAKSFPSFLGMILDHIRDRGGITLGSEDLDSSYGIGGGYIGKWISLESRFKHFLLPLITVSEETYLGSFTRLYLQQAGMNEKEASGHWKVLLETLFNSLSKAHHENQVDWLEFEERQVEENRTARALRLRFDKLRIRRPLHLFQCMDTGQVWPRSALGLHLRSARPSLELISKEQLAENPRIARVHLEWGSSIVFRHGLWAEEHSAQIGAGENRRLQDLFKAGIRNVLSSTTTLELGIDIGGLNGVMMGNIPPGKASYLQRAGRAGRRADGSSLVVSYSRNTPYERKVFEDFGGYLGSRLREPSVFLDRKDIIRRHVHSLLFGDFFLQAYGSGTTRGAMDAFGRMGTFANAERTSYWQREDSKPKLVRSDANLDVDEEFAWGGNGKSLAEAFENYLVRMSKETDAELEKGIRNLTRETGLNIESKEAQSQLISTLHSRVLDCMQRWKKDYEGLLKQWNAIPYNGDAQQRNFANALHHQLKQLYGMKLIEIFSDAMILPRYGFPIGLSELKVNPGMASKQANDEDHSEAYRLNRSASQAVSEYAPGSKILVGAKTVHSEGILKSWTGDDIPSEGMGLRAWYRWNDKSGEFRYQYGRFEDAAGEPQAEFSRQGEMLFVKHGFTSAASEQPTYGGSPARVGKVLSICRPPEAAEMTTTFEGFFGITGVRAQLHVGGELLAMNSGEYEQGFAVCTKCGYSRSEVKSQNNGENTGRVGLPKGFEWHAPIHQSDGRKNCWGKEESFILRHLHLAARQVCDYVEIELFGACGNSTEKRQIANTLGQALRLSGARLLNIDSREISLLRPTSGNSLRISICDSLAGGAGHVRDLSGDAANWWTAAKAMITEGSITQATLGLLTADIPTREGLPDLCIKSTREYLSRFEHGGWIQAEEYEKDELDFSHVLKA
jgi:DEAD/DEAH box helicase domain-containing protein